MTAITFDTLRFVKTLEAAGIEHSQAEAFAEAQREAFSELVSLGDLATKRDLSEMKYDLLKWIVGLALGQFALIMGILMKLSR
jgi:hypothetical protein